MSRHPWRRAATGCGMQRAGGCSSRPPDRDDRFCALPRGSIGGASRSGIHPHAPRTRARSPPRAGARRVHPRRAALASSRQKGGQYQYPDSGRWRLPRCCKHFPREARVTTYGSPEDSLPGAAEDWFALTGHRRFVQTPANADLPRITSFMSGTGFVMVGGNFSSVETRALRFNNFYVSHCRVTDLHLRWVRTHAHVQSRYAFIFVNRGRVAVESQSPHWTATGGGADRALSGCNACRAQRDRTQRHRSLHVRSEIAPHVLTPSNIDDVSPGCPALRAAFAYLQASTEIPRTIENVDEKTDVLRRLTREVALALTHTVISNRSSLASLQRAQRVIEACSADPDFDSDQLAKRCSISRRTLNRVFASAGLHVAQEIRRSRAERALPLLAARGRLTNAQIATASGFRSVANMHRALREAFGPTVGSSDVTGVDS